MENQVGKGLFWKLLERFGIQGVNFILQIILARLLDPSHYGVLSMMIIFVNLSNIFIQQGFSTSLIQNKDVSEEDYSSVFWITVAMAAIIYAGLFFATPLIAAFYEMPDFVEPFRVLCLVLFPGAINSIQLSKVSREMNFKQIFRSSIISTTMSGLVGIIMAYFGFGLWALVAQQITNAVVSCIVMWFTVAWRPQRVLNRERVKVLLSYGWKLMISYMGDTFYQDFRSLVIGKKYSQSTLGFYNRGKQFPQFFINSINGAVQSVLLPAMSSKQDDIHQMKTLMRNSVMLSSYIIFPMMAGLAGVATPLVRLLLTEKWVPCVPYLQIYCFILAFYPVHTSNLQAINAMGRSDVFLKLEVIKKTYGIIFLIIAVFCFDSPLAIAMTGVLTTVISSFINAMPNKELINYSYVEQIRDIMPSMIVSLIMVAAVLAVQLLNWNDLATIVLQVVVGVVVYVSVSAVCKLEPFLILLDMLKGMLKRRSNS